MLSVNNLAGYVRVTISKLLAWLLPVHLSFAGAGPLNLPLVSCLHMLALPQIGSLLKKLYTLKPHGYNKQQNMHLAVVLTCEIILIWNN